MKQTAVELLLYWMEQNQYFIGNDLLKDAEQAKEIEKQQIIDAYNAGQQKEAKQAFWTKGAKYYDDTFEK
jgi:hypothetical protein